MRSLDPTELRVVLVAAGLFAFAGMGIALALMAHRHIESYAWSKAAGALGFFAGGGLGWLLGMAIVLSRRR